jgi:putative ABC transport system ATP-binding protein
MLEIRGVAKRFDPATPLLDGLDLTVSRGEWVAIVGESGSGKSTLLNLIAGLDRPERGDVRLDSAPLHYENDDALALWRRRHVGFVFQAFHLLPYLTVGENVALPLALLKVAPSERRMRSEAALAAVGLAGFGGRRPSTLSGGEMQRTAIARAIVHEPVLILADEPTGNLDEGNATAVLQCLRDAVRRANACALMVTHSQRAAAMADRVMHLAGGRLTERAP